MGYYYYTSNYMLDMPHSDFRLRQNLITTISHSDEIYSRKIGLEELSNFFALDCFASDYNCHCFELQKIKFSNYKNNSENYTLLLNHDIAYK